MPNLITRLLLRLAKPCESGHLLHADGSVYMERFTLFESNWISARVHHIATPDWDRDMHDHPWSFVSVVLSGGYTEDRPASMHKPQWSGDTEARNGSRRSAGSVALRRPTDRHLISAVDPDTWTLFVYGPLRQWWGFYTRAGKIYWREYPSIHETAPRP
jgi:hypothetical protein